ncbi:MAG TPA: LCP family protein, partial [Actinomycetota bacterium]
MAAIGVLSLMVAAGSGLAIATIHHVEASIVKYDTRETDPNCTGFRCLQHVDSHCLRRACNYLVLGSDSRAGLTKQEQKKFGNPNRSKGQRSDTILVVQVDAKLDRTVVLSIPRDLRVDIPGHGFGKINTAFDYGPDVIVHTVENLTGLRINHYVEVNFLGFENLVNALGGIPICID